MNKMKTVRIPMRFIILDAIGAVLLGLGVAELFAGTNLVPKPWQFPNYAVFMVIFGIAFMLPMVTYILSRANSAGPRKI